MDAENLMMGAVECGPKECVHGRIDAHKGRIPHLDPGHPREKDPRVPDKISTGFHPSVWLAETVGLAALSEGPNGSLGQGPQVEQHAGMGGETQLRLRREARGARDVLGREPRRASQGNLPRSGDVGPGPSPRTIARTARFGLALTA